MYIFLPRLFNRRCLFVVRVTSLFSTLAIRIKDMKKKKLMAMQMREMKII